MEDSRDSQVLVCKKCGQLKKRIRQGKRINSKDTKFVGEDGKEWNGLVCSTCVVEVSRQRKRDRALTKKSNV
jgi:hypothetical protein